MFSIVLNWNDIKHLSLKRHKQCVHVNFATSLKGLHNNKVTNTPKPFTDAFFHYGMSAMAVLIPTVPICTCSICRGFPLNMDQIKGGPCFDRSSILANFANLLYIYFLYVTITWHFVFTYLLFMNLFCFNQWFNRFWPLPPFLFPPVLKYIGNN